MTDQPINAHRASLKAAGLQVTAQRLSVLAALDQADHPTVDSIFERVRADIGSVSRQAIYDALHTLTAEGIIHSIEPAGSPSRFEGRTDNHHHLICRRCGEVRDVDCHRGKAPCMDPVDNYGYRIDEAEVIYWGLCPVCQSDEE